MKKLFLAFAMLLSSFSSYAQDKEEKDFAVIVFYRKADFFDNGCSSEIIINNLEACQLNFKTRVIHKVYSEGSLLIQERFNCPEHGSSIGAQMNVEIKNGDTIFIYVTKIGNKKPQSKSEYFKNVIGYKFANNLITKERIDIPYNPITKSKLSKGVERSGTGFLVSEQGYILTNFHVIDGTKEIMVKGVNGNPKSSLSATVVLKDEANDLALLKLDDRILLDSIKYSIKKEQADVGQTAYVLGYPLPTSMGSEIKLTNGLVSSKSGFEGNVNSYQISAAVQGGNSGGPVFDDKGNIIAVVNAKHLDAENVTYAIKTKYLFDLIESSDTKINIHTTSSIANKSLSEQTKELSKFVYMIIAK